MNTKKNVAGVATAIYDLLETLEPEERQRAISAALTLLGAPVSTSLHQTPVSINADRGGVANGVSGSSPVAYFGAKDPHSKIEEIAVAARYREQFKDALVHTKEELQAVFKEARRNFDSKNFGRDMDNARVKGFFTRDKDITLAYYGQQYVDVLPDRDAAKGLRRPKKVKSKSRASQKEVA